MNKELKIKKINELIKELNEYKACIEKDTTYKDEEKLDKLLYDKEKNADELFNWKFSKIKIEYAEYDNKKHETLLMSIDENYFAKDIVDGYNVVDEKGNFIIRPLERFNHFITEIQDKFMIDEKYIIELCKLNKNRQIILDFMKNYKYDSIAESPGDIRFDFDCNYISFKYDNDEIEVIDPSLEIFNEFKKVYPQAVISTISPLCF